MIDDNLLHTLAKYFGIRGINTMLQTIKDDNGNIIEQVQPTLIWIVQTQFFHTYSGGLTTTIATIHTDKWSKAILLVPKSDKSFIDTEPIRAIHITKEDDILKDALQVVNLNMVSKYVKLGDERSRNFTLQVTSTNVYSKISFTDPISENKSFQNLWDGIIHMINVLVSKYNNDELSRFIKLGEDLLTQNLDTIYNAIYPEDSE